MSTEQLPLGQVLNESGHAVSSVYFPIDSIVSLLCVMEDGASAEISLVGKDGLVGFAVFMDEFNRSSDMRVVVLRYTQSLITQMAQTVICNRHHSIVQQLCRWLLLSMDRLPNDRLTMTQELIANMLGVRREGVNEAAGKLQKMGVIEYHHGEITVLDRPELEKQCCECYAVVKRETDRLQS